MRTILCFIMLLCLSNLIPAQSLAQSSKEPTVYAYASNSPEESTRLKNQHTLSVISQLRNFLNNNLSYPEISEEYSFEGEVNVEIRLSENAEIQELRFIDNPILQIEKIIRSTLNNFSSGFGKDQPYMGAHKFLIPISFLLK